MFFKKPFDINKDGKVGPFEAALAMSVTANAAEREAKKQAKRNRKAAPYVAAERTYEDTQSISLENELDDLRVELSELEDRLSDLEYDEPDESCSEAYEEWEAEMEELQDHMDEIEYQIEEIESSLW